MDIAEHIAPEETEPLPWTEICARYPDQYVCLVDIHRAEPQHPEIKTARVIGHGLTHREAFEPARDLCLRYSVHAVRFTGVCTEPLIRPALVIDDETLEFLRS
jgi:hypothetical protein